VVLVVYGKITAVFLSRDSFVHFDEKETMQHNALRNAY
jgi:hypothetical protein